MRKPGVERKLRHLAAHRGDGALGVDGLQVLQQIAGLGVSRKWRWIEKGKPGRIGNAPGREIEGKGGEISDQNFRRIEGAEGA